MWEEEGPPIHIVAALYFGLGGKKKKKKANNLDELAKMFPGGVIEHG